MPLSAPARTLLVALALLLGTTLAPAASSAQATAPAAGRGDSPTTVDWGRTKAPDQRFRQKCHDYRYRYRIDPPTKDWTLETFLRGPHGKQLGFGYFLAGNDPKRDRRTFRVCGATTNPGRWTIRAKVTYLDGFDEHVVRLEKSRFRVTRG